MSDWNVYVTFDAGKVVIVDAESKEEAMIKAMTIVSKVTLCHHCSRNIELNDPIQAVDAWQ